MHSVSSLATAILVRAPPQRKGKAPWGRGRCYLKEQIHCLEISKARDRSEFFLAYNLPTIFGGYVSKIIRL